MSVDEFLHDLSVRLTFRGRQRARVLDEVRDHLHDAVRTLEAKGAGDAAERGAVQAFGQPADLARQFNAAVATTTMRRTPLVIGASGIVVVGGFLFAATTQPRPSVSTGAGLLLQVVFFAAVLGVQFAVVAGARAAARVAALWRTNVARDEDRMLVRRCAVVCAGGLAIATVGWSAALAIAWRHLPHVRVVTMVTGMALMTGAALATIAILRRHPAAAADGESAPAPPSAGVLLGAGESVIALVRRRPAPVCAVVATIAALLAMSAAETTVVGAIPSGVAEAAAVVAGFVLLGPRLGLRGSASAHDGVRATTAEH